MRGCRPASCGALAFGLALGGPLGGLLGWSGAVSAQPVEVTVSAPRPLLEHASRSPSLASSVLSGEPLRAAGSSASEVLARVPGVQVTRTGAQSDLATASIRGAEASQVPVYLAGIRINDDVGGTADLSSIPLWMIERVEVFRGNAPDNADRLGMGGAIFFWPRLPGETRGSLGQGVGSFGEHHHWGSVEAAGSSGALLLSVHHAGADNDYPFVNDQGQRFDLDERSERRVNADYAQTDAWLLGRARLGRGARVHGVLHALDREQGVTGLSVVPARFARSETRRLLAGHSVVVPCAANGCRLELSSSLIAAESTLRDPFVELPALRSRRLDTSAQRIDHALHADFGNADRRLGLAVQGSFGRLEVDRLGNRPRRATRMSLSPRLTASSRIGSGLSLGLLLGLECHSTSGLGVALGAPVFSDEGACHVREPVGRLSARQALGPRLDLIANVGRYVRLPSLSELYGSSPAVEGNSRLEPERGLSADLGLRHAFTSDDEGTLRTALEAFAFARSVEGLIRYRRTGIETLSPFNVASARLLGIEAAAAAELWQALRLESSLTLLDPRETTDDPLLDPTVNDILPNTARLTLALGLRAIARDWPESGGLDRVELGARYLHRSSRFEDAAGQNVLPAQDFVDLDLALRFAGGHLLLRLATRNALDWRGSDVIGLPVPGRSQHATAEGWF